ncbi:tripartite tricarboxylate transporter substrate-binding protein [Variovorax humicola]|uniref:Tripartite tricarboxylate transporter substrate-binding protein n=1 Tax=Variovorax humicola TaxID=1769758 RepID=A0ABU8W7C6_9BURK
MEAGVPGFEAGSWFGILAPAHTPKDVVARLDRDIEAALRTPDMQARLIERGFQPAIKGPEAFSKYIGEEVRKWDRIVKQSGATAE